MRITRIQVEEGFLDGLDLGLSQGLNVLIGPRGSGKTSIIELVRFCLEAPSFTERSGAIAREHARSILGAGQVTVTLAAGDQEISVSRTAEESHARTTATYTAPTVLSQNEIETIGLNAVSRLRLLDAFRASRDVSSEQTAKLRGTSQARTGEAKALQLEIEKLDEQLKSLTTEVGALPQLLTDQQEQLSQMKDAAIKQAATDAITAELAAASVQGSVYQRTLSAVEAWRDRLGAVSDRPPHIEAWPASAGTTDGLFTARDLVAQAGAALRQANELTSEAVDRLRGEHQLTAARRIELEARARDLRSELDTLQRGSGALARRISELSEKDGQRGALLKLRTELAERRKAILDDRDSLLDQLDVLSESEFGERRAVAEFLNRQLHGKIRIEVERSGLPTAYVEAVRAALKGSGLKYNALAPLIAERLSPRELISAVERQDAGLVAEVLGIALDRAARITAEIANCGAEDIVACQVDDTATLRLLDGSELTCPLILQ